AKKLKKNNIALHISGDLSAFDSDLMQTIKDCKGQAGDGSGGVTNVCLNYGGRADIINAVNIAVKNGLSQDEKSFSALLSTHPLPDPDLLVRTGGDMRLSNFFLYQCAYAELYFCKTLWPDFSDKDLIKALAEYKSRDRRFGKIL
ncbi:MAG: polyprenyl diphosphate synthase, partial [Firmicutes bacterium]|nr:polyprenyl diphosphate synthase [Bacillota bacterium]